MFKRITMDKQQLKYEKYIKNNSEYNECENDFCDLDPSKVCDSCGKCIEEDKNYKIIKITKVLKNGN